MADTFLTSVFQVCESGDETRVQTATLSFEDDVFILFSLQTRHSRTPLSPDPQNMLRPHKQEALEAQH